MLGRTFLMAWMSACLLVAGVARAEGTQLAIEAAGGTHPHLLGRDTHLQLVVSAQLTTGEVRDHTRLVKYTAQPAGIIQVSESGLVTSVRNGDVAVTATEDDASASLAIKVEHCGSPLPINFANQIVPVFTKAGCNTGGCHGKLSGQNGFRLS